MKNPMNLLSCMPVAIRLIAAGMLLAVAMFGCGIFGPETPKLRIVNRGEQAIQKLTVFFPKDEIPFGDVPAGATTDYQDVPHGVYNAPAFQFEINGQSYNQPVIDWVGDKPMPSERFTYVLEFDSKQGRINLIEIRTPKSTLAKKWQDDRSAKEIIDDIYTSRTLGREFQL